MGYGGVATVAVDVLAALTVLPALLAVLGHRVNALRIRRLGPAPAAGGGRVSRARDESSGAWYRLARSVMRRPLVYVTVITIAPAGPGRAVPAHLLGRHGRQDSSSPGRRTTTGIRATRACRPRSDCGAPLPGPGPGQHRGPGRGGALHRRRYGDGYLSYTHIDAPQRQRARRFARGAAHQRRRQLQAGYFGQALQLAHRHLQRPGKRDRHRQQHHVFSTRSASAPTRARPRIGGATARPGLDGFGMFTRSTARRRRSRSARIRCAATGTWDMSTKKLKFGVDAHLHAAVLAGGGRALRSRCCPTWTAPIRERRSRPRTDGRPRQSGWQPPRTSAFSPARLVIKTQFVTHESVSCRYSRYFLGSGLSVGLPLRLGAAGRRRRVRAVRGDVVVDFKLTTRPNDEKSASSPGVNDCGRAFVGRERLHPRLEPK